MADQLCTVAQVKTRIFPTGVTDASDDVMLGELVDQVSAWIQTYTGRKLVPEVAATYLFDTQAGYVLRVPRGIRSITSMGIATTHQPTVGGAYTTLSTVDAGTNLLLRPLAADLPVGWPATEIRISRQASLISKFADAENGATITGNFGFASTPLEVVAVAIDAVVAAYAVRKNGASGVIGAEGQAVIPWSQFFGRGSPQRGTLDRYVYQAMA